MDISMCTFKQSHAGVIDQKNSVCEMDMNVEPIDQNWWLAR